MSDFIFIACLAAPPLLMWWMIVVQRRVRQHVRAKRETEESWSPEASYVDQLGGEDGLTYGRAFEPPSAPPPDIRDLPGVQALNGKR